MQACRDSVRTIDRRSHNPAHIGLLLSRYLREAVPGPSASKAEKESHTKEKRELHQEARQAAASARRLYASCFQRWRASLPISAPQAELSVHGRLIVGLGSDNALETGISLHHIYGVPIIPGSALKGLAAHYCDHVWSRKDEEFRKCVEFTKEDGRSRQRPGHWFLELFGTTDDAGHIIFHDAWIDPGSLTGQPDSGLVLDVMTPHHGDYYAGRTYEAGPRRGQAIPPTDFDDPNPVTFLSVTGRFHVAVSCDVDSDEGRKWAKLAFDLLKEALESWGVGGKTSSGYGRLRSTAQQAQQSPAPQPPPAAELAKPTGRRYRRGDRISVTRIEDPGGRSKVRFQAEDGTIGHFGKDESPPSVPLGEGVEVWVANAGGNTYTLTLKQPAMKHKQPPQGKKGPRR